MEEVIKLYKLKKIPNFKSRVLKQKRKKATSEWKEIKIKILQKTLKELMLQTSKNNNIKNKVQTGEIWIFNKSKRIKRQIINTMINLRRMKKIYIKSKSSISLGKDSEKKVQKNKEIEDPKASIHKFQ